MFSGGGAYGGGGLPSNYDSYSTSTLKPKQNVSYDTSSKEPQMMRSRIFVGGLNTNVVTRDDVIQLFGSYGTILGVTIFKKYAFIQYSNATEADLAISALNMYHWHGSALDVKLAVTEKQLKEAAVVAKTPSAPVSVNGAPSKRSANEGSVGESKRKREESVNEENPEEEIPDRFICGGCHYVTSSLEAFVKHRKQPCNTKLGKKSRDEPKKFDCMSCEASFDLSWELLAHLSTKHNLTVFRDAAKQAA